MLVVVLALMVLTSTHLVAMAAVGAAIGVPPRQLRLGFGPAILRRERLVLGLLPLGGSVQFAAEGEPAFAGRDAWKGAVVAAAGCGALVVVGLALGAELVSLPRGWVQYVRGALHPGTVGVPLLRALAAASDAAPLGVVGVLAMKLAAFNLVPLPGTNGAQILGALVAQVRPQRPPPSGVWLAVGVLPMLALIVGWAIAVGMLALSHAHR